MLVREYPHVTNREIDVRPQLFRSVPSNDHCPSLEDSVMLAMENKDRAGFTEKRRYNGIDTGDNERVQLYEQALLPKSVSEPGTMEQEPESKPQRGV